MEISEEAIVDVDYNAYDLESETERSESKCGYGSHRIQPSANNQLLPIDFNVYVKDNVVVNWPAPGPEARTLPTFNYSTRPSGGYVAHLPTFNHYSGPNGGYIALYSHNEKAAIYGVGDGIYVIGQVRLPG
ncbi:MAG: hypothetical protein K1060chlam2_00484, partial [Chlamydiae bacterium]|nr:hypothetical protein [Chlamydiota bacterium]